MSKHISHFSVRPPSLPGRLPGAAGLVLFWLTIGWPNVVGCSAQRTDADETEPSATGSSPLGSFSATNGSVTTNSADSDTPPNQDAGRSSAQPDTDEETAFTNRSDVNSSSTAQGSTPDAPNSETGSPDAAQTPDETPSDAGTAPGVDFSQGSRFVVPQDVQSVVTLNLAGQFPPQARPAATWQLLEHENLPREYELRIAHEYLYADRDPDTGEGVNCRPYPGLLYGDFEVASVEVREDVLQAGAHLTVVQDGDHYKITHDGIGSHDLVVRGSFVAEDATLCPEVTDDNGRVDLEFTTRVEVVRAASVQSNLALHCGTDPLMLSGRGFPGLSLTIFNPGGLYLSPANVGYFPIDLTIETEKEAAFEVPEHMTIEGLTITGKRQRVRLSTEFGVLATYEIAELGDVNAWDVQFWSTESLSPKFEREALVPNGSTPVLCSGSILGAEATVTVDGRGICSPILRTDFEVVRAAQSECDIGLYDGYDELPGPLTELTSDALCEFDLRLPAANRGTGLSAHLAASLITDTSQIAE